MLIRASFALCGSSASRERPLSAGGARRLGWKLGTGERERIGGGPVLGYLTTASELPDGGVYTTLGDGALHADAEVALELGEGCEIVAYRAALELVDLAGPDSAEAIVAANVFHRAVVFGPRRESLPPGVVEARLIVNDGVRASASGGGDYRKLAERAGQLLVAVGEELLPGDRLITGAIVQEPVRAGDQVLVDLGPLGSVRAAVHPARDSVKGGSWGSSRRVRRGPTSNRR